MSEYQKALIVILVLASCTFAFAKKALVPLVPDRQFKIWRNTWMAITVIAFLASDFWIFIVASMLLLLYISPRQQNPLSLYFVLLFALPPFGADIPGFGVINFLFSMDYYRMLSLCILLPSYLYLRSQADTTRFGKLLPDKFLFIYIILIVLLNLRDTTFTDSLREGFYKFTDIFLPYYIASRAVKNLNQLKEAFIALILSCAVLAAIGIFEFIFHWLLYSNLQTALGVEIVGKYLPRGEYLRAVATLGQPIVMGYVMVVVLGTYLYLSSAIKSKNLRLLGFALLLGGLVAPLSRGPWIGAAALILVFIATGPYAIKRLSMLAFALLIIMPFLGQIPGGQKVIDLLPFVGTTETENIDYREKLLDNSLIVFNRHPLLGSVDYRNQLADLGMKQGEGIVDVVNSYLDIVLGHGLIGLFLFLGFFWLALSSVIKRMRENQDKKSELYLLGRALLSTVLAILLTIFTVSSIMVIPIVYWITAGLCISYARMSLVPAHQASSNIRSRNLPTSRLRSNI